ncbi:hypothetical protein AB0K02_27320 [Streptomyces sp. NPDC049597]|uniref:DUF7660 family protein n=1 Tax=Streptomyces sp. NPDC049597 TaxID=3155276 RepID=UPI00344607D6
MPQPTYGSDAAVTSREALIHHIHQLREDLLANGDGWENPTLERYLESMAAWINDSAGYHRSRGEEPPGPDWEFIGNALRAAALYE